MSEENATIELLREQFPEQVSLEKNVGMTTVVVPKAVLLDVMLFLRDDDRCSFEQLNDVIGIDYLGYPEPRPRFALVYPMLSVKHNRRVFIKVYLEEPDLTVRSLTGIYRGAEWPEREAAEMLGVTFEGSPEAGPFVLPDDWDGPPPLQRSADDG